MVVIDDEIIKYLKKLLQREKFSDMRLMVDEIKAVGPGQSYIGRKSSEKYEATANQISGGLKKLFENYLNFKTGLIQEQISANKDLVTESMMDILGQDDLFTKAMIDSSINKVDNLLDIGIPDDALIWLGMMGLKVIVDFHGEVVEIEAPAQADFGDYE